MITGKRWTRRDALRLAVAAGLTPTALHAAAAETMRTRPIPSTGEPLPVVGLGTYEVFDVGGSPDEVAMRRDIVDRLLDAGGSVLDTSPMYNRSERIIGEVLDASGRRNDCFLATKVWTDGKDRGAAQMQRSADLMNVEVIDLMQVHNLRDTDVHMDTIRAWQESGRLRYNGITHYTAGALGDMEAAMKKHKPQFIQINYSLGEREADKRLLPLAADMGIAVIANRPFVTGKLFAAVRGRELPDWATAFADSWGQFFLKYIIGHDAISCVIPATSKATHMADNLGAGFGPLPDAAARERMVRFMASL